MSSSYQPHSPPLPLHLLADYIIRCHSGEGKTAAKSYCVVGDNKQYYY